MYNPIDPPLNREDLSRWIIDELRKIDLSITQDRELLGFSPTYNEPKKPIVGQVYYSSGAPWNPGQGEGLYEYTSGGYAKLGGLNTFFIEEVKCILKTPPVHIEGERYIIEATATGEWTGKENQIAESVGGVWEYTLPKAGMQTFVECLDRVYFYSIQENDWIATGATISHIDVKNKDIDGHPADIIVVDPPVDGRNDVQSILVEMDDQIGLRETAATGTIIGGNLAQASDTTIDILFGKGEIVDGYTDRTRPTRVNTTWATTLGFTVDTPSAVGMQVIYVDSNGIIKQQPAPLSNAQRRTNIQIGFVTYSENIIRSVEDGDILSNEVGNTLYDWLAFSSPSDKVKGLGVSPVDGALSIWGENGSLLSPGINVLNDIQNPNIKDMKAIGDVNTPAPFTVAYSDGTTYASNVTVMPNVYEVSPGNTSNLVGNQAVIHYIYRTRGNTLILQLGQTLYNDAKLARDSLEIDRSKYKAFLGSEATIAVAQSYHAGNASNYDDSNKAGLVSLIGSGSNSSGGVAVSSFLDLTDVDESTYGSNARKIVTVNDVDGVNGDALIFNDVPMTWRGVWSAGSYLQDDVVRDGSWTMIANKDTTDRAAPQLIGDPAYIYNGILTTSSPTAKKVLFGNRYTFQEAGVFSTVRIYTSIGKHYTLFTVNDPNGMQAVTELADFTAKVDGYTNIAFSPSIVFAGTEVDVMVAVNEPDPAPTVNTFNYNYTTPVNNDAPASGTILHSNDISTLMNINKVDSDSNDVSAFLEGLSVGDIIEGANVSWSIQAVTDNLTYMSYEVAPGIQDSPEGVQTFSFKTITPTPISYGSEIDYNLGNANIRGMFIVDGSYQDILPDDNQYGVDILFQLTTASLDWDVVATNSGGASGDVNTFTLLQDTPNSYIGNSLRAVTVNADENGLEYTDFTGALLFKGTWNADINDPTLLDIDGVPSGWFYSVVVKGTTDFGSGDISFNVGDSVIYNGTVWQRMQASKSDRNVDGGKSDAVYLPSQVIDGGDSSV